MALLLIVAPRGYARCVITLTPRSDAREQHRLQFQQVLPMFPVNFVTYLPGCTRNLTTRCHSQDLAVVPY